MNSTRRSFLKQSLVSMAVVGLAGAGLLRPRLSLAADWPQPAFSAKSIDEALKNLYGSTTVKESTAIRIKAPLQAENGAQVPIEVMTDLKDITNINVLVKENVQPLAANVRVNQAAGFFKARIKMAKTSDVYVVVNAGGKRYVNKQMIKVTAGGCGG